MTTLTQPNDTRDPQTYDIIGGAMDVHCELGSGFLEPVYHRPLAIELATRQIPFAREVPYEVIYKGQPTGLYYRADFVCFGEIIIELKAVRSLGPVDEAQAINYLKVSKLKRALLINFGAKSLEWRRLVL
jgi:GxxExxY protein